MSNAISLRRRIKKFWYGKIPGIRGSFPYFGTKVHFPTGSLSFSEACKQGIFEAENVHLLRSIVVPGTWMFDVGANIGLMAIPVLQAVAGSRVLSFEPSPNSVEWIKRTACESRFADRWQIVTKAAGASSGTTTFFASPPEAGVYDGVNNTHRIAGASEVKVEMTTLDHEWRELGCPHVSVIKIDVEGFETEVLKGARGLIDAQKPRILLEWNAQNLIAADVRPGRLIDIANELHYRIATVPEFIEVSDADMLQLQMMQTESFLLFPRSYAIEGGFRVGK